jgi:hypothetical protein
MGPTLNCVQIYMCSTCDPAIACHAEMIRPPGYSLCLLPKNGKNPLKTPRQETILLHLILTQSFYGPSKKAQKMFPIWRDHILKNTICVGRIPSLGWMELTVWMILELDVQKNVHFKVLVAFPHKSYTTVIIVVLYNIFSAFACKKVSIKLKQIGPKRQI